MSQVSVRQIIEGCVVGSKNVSSVNLVSNEQQFAKRICIAEVSINFPSSLQGYAKENSWEETFSLFFFCFLPILRNEE